MTTDTDTDIEGDELLAKARQRSITDGIVCPIKVAHDDTEVLNRFLQGIYDFAHVMRVSMRPLVPSTDEERQALKAMCGIGDRVSTFKADIPHDELHPVLAKHAKPVKS